ncbi:MAG: DnaJ domain-containing protein [Kofleriaceae bacterium]|jgi:curved DNA-binding protein CbpA|nr:DnaJ domain-containing protein [Kofleriaceae bacterium]MBP6841251.1 DnaJ domain-containing protein [Kofleriaceae bacterium]MBP9203852.1 DnaJ domain-containing protein [Kofleriaceae bacterium]
MTGAELMAWLKRMEALPRDATHYQVLGLAVGASTGDIAAEFRRIAGAAHPDLHRLGLSPADTERLVRVYSRVAAAYATLRDPEQRRRYDRARTTRPPTIPPPSGQVAEGSIGVGQAPGAPMAPRAVTYYRKAQAALGAGDLGAAQFNLRLAIAADPASAVLRMALAEVERALTGK